MLAVSGTLDATMYGAGTLDEAMNRRSIYFMVKRSQLIPLMMLFDAPDSLQGIGNRPNTTIAPQALAMLNNPHIERYAQNFAGKIAEPAKSSLQAGVTRAYLLALGRAPTPIELPTATTFVESQRSSYAAAGKPDPLVPALADFCQTLFALSEFIYVE